MQRYNRAESRPRKSRDVAGDFAKKFALPLHETSKIKSSLALSELQRFKTTVTQLNFETGMPVNSNVPALLKLLSVDYVEKFVLRVKPWIDLFGKVTLKNFSPHEVRTSDTPAMKRYRAAEHFSHVIDAWLSESRSDVDDDTLLYETTWCPHSSRSASKFLSAPKIHDYIWRRGYAYHNLNPMPDGYAGCRPDMMPSTMPWTRPPLIARQSG